MDFYGNQLGQKQILNTLEYLQYFGRDSKEDT